MLPYNVHPLHKITSLIIAHSMTTLSMSQTTGVGGSTVLCSRCMILKIMVTSKYTIVCCAAKYNQCRYTTDKYVLYRNQENAIFMLDSTYTICTVETLSGWGTFCSKSTPPLRYAPSKFISIPSYFSSASSIHTT